MSSSLINSLQLTESEEEYIRRELIQMRAIMSWEPGIEGDQESLEPSENWNVFPTFTPLIASCVTGKNKVDSIVMDRSAS